MENLDMIYPEIVQVVPREDYSVLIYFEDGKVTCYDVSSLLDRGVFKLLKDKDFFMNRCMILNDTLAWDVSGNRDVSKCIDIAPETLYLSAAVKSLNNNRINLPPFHPSGGD